LYGLDLKTNVVDVTDGFSLGCENVFQNNIGVIAKRRGNSVAFEKDHTSSSPVREIGSCIINGTKFYFKFIGTSFFHATASDSTAVTTEIASAVAASGDIYWATLNNKLYFVDGTSALKFFDGTTIKTSLIYQRPTVTMTSSGGTGFDYSYTVDNGLGESPINTNNFPLNQGATIVATIPANTGPQTLQIGDRIRVYSKPTSTVAQWRNVTPTSGSTAELSFSSDASGGYATITSTATPPYEISTIALTEDSIVLYTDLGVAINTSAPTALTGITAHYGRLVGWKGSSVFCSKVTNSDSWPSDSALREAFTYGFFTGDGENITVCKSYKESLYVFKDTKLAAFGGVGPDDTANNAFTFRRIETNGIGCVAGKSIQVVGDDETTNNYLVWLSNQGFYASNGDTPLRIGEDIETQVVPVSLSNKRLSVSFYHARDGFYYCFVGTASSKDGWILDVTKDKQTKVGWFNVVNINPTCIHWDDDKYIFGNNTGFCAVERTSGTASDFSDIRTEYIAAASINTGSDQITVATSYQTGDEITIRTTGTIPGGLTANSNLFVIRVSSTVIKLATSSANATNGIAINITSQGTGTHTLVSKQAISAFYSTNWINFNTVSKVKKLQKPMVLLNASASLINLDMTIAVDWYESFFDPHVISVTSNHLWGDNNWGDFIWAAGSNATPRNIAIARRKCRSIRYKFSNNTLNQDFNLKGLALGYDLIRNRGEFG
jgi:hypothetical protein